MSVPAGYGAYLKSPARYASATISGAQATWGDKALDSSILSPLAYQADAQAEAIRQAQFLAGPLARDVHVVPGLWSRLIGLPITLSHKRFGYDIAPVVFVIGAQESQTENTTTLTVLKRL